MNTRVKFVILFGSHLLECVTGYCQPTIDYQPKDQVVILYQQAAFGVIASGTAPLSYQWSKDSLPIAGATNDQIVLGHAQFSEAGRYSAVVSNSQGTVTSADAVLTVNSPAAGDLDYSFAWGGSINGEVSSVAVQPDGKVLIAGYFSTVHKASRSGIARLNADGTTDYTFVNGLPGDNYFYSVAVQNDGKVLIGGNFTTVDGSRTGIGRLNPDGSLDRLFQNGVVEVDGGADVRSITLQSDGKVLIGGNFMKVHDVSRSRLARLNADGTLDRSFLNDLAGVEGTDSPNNSIYSIAVQSDGKVLIGGDFTSVNGASRTNIARLNPDGTLDHSFLNGLFGANGPVHSVMVQSDGKILIGGWFSAVNELSREQIFGIARLNADGSLDSSFQNGFEGHVNSVALQSDGKVLIGSTSQVVRLNSDGTLDRSFQIGHGGAVYSRGVTSVVVQQDGKVLVGLSRDFTGANGTIRTGIARLNSDGSVDTGFQNESNGPFPYVYSVVVQADARVLIGGVFTTVNGVSRANLARLNADGTLDPGFLKGLSGVVGGYNTAVNSVAVQNDGKVLIGGQFTAVNGVGRSNVARLNADGTLDSSFQDRMAGIVGGFSAAVHSLAAQNSGKVLVGGDFNAVNGISRTNLARLNNDGTLDNDFQNISFGGLGSSQSALFRPFITSLALQRDGKLVIGGNFTSVNGETRNRIARLYEGGTLDKDFQNELSGFADNDFNFRPVRSIAIQSDGKIIVGGGFKAVNGVNRPYIARLNSDGTLDNDFRNTVYANYSGVNSVAVQSNGKVLIGGDFGAVDKIIRGRIARLNANGALDSTFLNGLSGAERGDVYSIAIQSDGKVLIGGNFTIVNGMPAAGIARLWGSAEIPPTIKSIYPSGGGVNLIWHSIPNRSYRVQYKEKISEPTWTDLAGDISATAATANQTDTISGSAGQRYYRVMLLP